MQLIKEVIQLPVAYSITGEQEETRNEIALRASAVVAVIDVPSLELAGASAKEIRRHLKDVEDARVTLTAPLLAAQRLLKSLSDDYCKPLADELKRLERMATDFNDAEKRRVQEAERVRIMAFQRANQERLEAEEKARKSALKINTDGQLAKAMQTEQAALEAAQKAQDILRAPTAEVAKAKGQSVRKYLKHEVLDIKAVYAARPELCHIEIKPAAVQATCVPEVPVPGLHLYWQERSTFSTR